jgi:hypothetical protein
VTVEGPDGVLASIGQRATSGRWTRLVLGTDRVALGRWDVVRRAAVPTVLAAARARVAGLRTVVVRRALRRR